MRSLESRAGYYCGRAQYEKTWKALVPETDFP